MDIKTKPGSKAKSGQKSMRPRRALIRQFWRVITAMSGVSRCATQKPAPEQPGSLPQLSNSIWLPNWRMKRSLDSAISALRQGTVKTVSPFWYEVGSRGVLKVKTGSDGLYIPDSEQILALKQQGARILPTVTTTLSPADFIATYVNEAAQQDLAEQLTQQIVANEYDGIDLCFETIALTTEPKIAKQVRFVFTTLCETLQRRMLQLNKRLAITVMARWSDGYEVWRDKFIPAVYDYPRLSELASLFRVMAWDRRAPNTPAGPVAGYEWVKNICDYTARKVKAPEKVEIGVALHGRDWGLATVKNVLHENVVQLKERYPKSQNSYCTRQKEEIFVYTNAAGEPHIVWYSNSQSVLDRLALIRAYRFGGAVFRAASYEDPGLWRIIMRENTHG